MIEWDICLPERRKILLPIIFQIPSRNWKSKNSTEYFRKKWQKFSSIEITEKKISASGNLDNCKKVYTREHGVDGWKNSDTPSEILCKIGNWRSKRRARDGKFSLKVFRKIGSVRLHEYKTSAMATSSEASAI